MLKRLELQGVGPADHLEIDFAPRVNLITGDNGLGKSFLLDIAWWATTAIWADRPARPRADNAIVTVKSESRDLQFTTAAHYHWKAQEQDWSLDAAAQNLKTGHLLPAPLMLYARVDGGFAVWDPARSPFLKPKNSDPSDSPRAHAYLFSPSNVWDGLSPKDPKDSTRTQWLCEGLIRDWASWQKENGPAFRQLCSVLKELSSHPDEQLEPGELTRISLDDNRDMPTLRTPYGEEVAIVHASAAIRRIAAMAYLLVWTWQEHKKACRLLKQATTNDIVFLIDEIEAHLHPAWQRRILRSLMNVTKALADGNDVAVQIIAVTHSPMLLASMEPVFDPDKDALWLFDLADAHGQKTVHFHQDDWHRRGDASAWLRSDIFDLGEARSVEAEEAMVAARAFMDRDVPDAPEFQRIYELLRRSLPGLDPFWVDWRAWAFGHRLLDEQKP